MKRLLKRTAQIVIGKLFFVPFYVLRGWWPVWFYVLNSESRRMQKKSQDFPFLVEEKIAQSLRKDGIAFISIDELFPGEKKLDELKQYAEALLPKAHLMEEKDFNLELWPENCTLDFQNPFVRLALEDRVLAIVGAYLGVWGKIFYYSLWLTRVISKDSPRFRSQNWHRDPDDKRMCKMFLYLKDIGENSGPFQYVKGSQYGGRWGHIAPQHPPKGSYPPDKDVEQRVAAEDILICTGRVGTIIFADTAGLHRGGYATGSERLMFTAEYSSNATFRPPRFSLPEDFGAYREKFSPRARFALDGQRGIVSIFNRLSDFSRKYDLY